MDKSALTVSCSNCYCLLQTFARPYYTKCSQQVFSYKDGTIMLQNRLPFIASESVKPMQKIFLENLAKYS